MGDPRNVAHAKKVTQEKQHKAKAAQKTVRPSQPGKCKLSKRNRPQLRKAPHQSRRLKNRHSREIPHNQRNRRRFFPSLRSWSFILGHIEKLAELSLTIEEELKQKDFAEAIGAVYAAQDTFQSKIVKLIEDYEAECTRLSGSA